MWDKFLQRVWGNTEGWAYLAYSSKGEWRNRAIKYPSQLKLVNDLIEKLKPWANVYFCPHLFDRNIRQKPFSLPTMALWIDKDDGNADEIQPKPTICWQTSEGRFAAVWLLNKPLDPTKVEQINRYLTYKNTKKDRAGWHLAKVIRVPQTLNHKHTPPQDGFILWDDGPTYDPEDLAEQVKTEEYRELLKEHMDRKMPEVLPDYATVLKEYGRKIPPAVWELMNTDPSPEEDWSENLWKVERLLIETGLPLEAVFVVTRESPWNKYRRDGRPDEQLWNEIVKAYEEKPPITPDTEKGKSLPWVGLKNLLIHSERPKWLVEGIWMEKNVGWIAGVGKSYKSTISLDLALSVASGHPFLGQYKVHNPGPVLMVQEEDPIWRVANRIQRIAGGKHISTTRVQIEDKGVVFEFPPDAEQLPIYVSIGGGFMFRDKSKVEALEEALDLYRPRMVFLDPLFMLTPGMDEFKAGEIVEVLNLMKYWRNKYECAIAVIHHYNKAQNGDGRGRLYGSMALYAWSENSLFVEREGNGIVIDRDIKDALVHDKISVTYFEEDEDSDEYNFTVSQGSALGQPAQPTAKDKVTSFLRAQPTGTTLFKADVMKATKVSEKTVSTVIDELVEQNCLFKDYHGRGKKMRITIREELFSRYPAFSERKEGGKFQF